METLNNRPRKANTRFIVVTVLLAAAIFAVDVSLPLGHTVWVPYVVLVLLCLWAPYRNYAVVLAAACTVLIILGFLFCPPGVSPGVGLFNRSLGVGVIWVTAILCLLRKRTEEALGKSQARLAGLVGSAMDAIVSISADQRIILFNAAAEKMFRCSANEAIGQPIDRFIPDRFRTAHREHVHAFGETNVTRRSMGTLGAIYGLRADGEEFPIEASISQVVADGQKLYTVILRDITERRRAEAALQESEAHFRAVAESAPNAFVGTDSGGRIVSWNKAAQRIFQYAEEEILGQPLTIIMPERYSDDCQKGIERHQRTGSRHFIGRTVELHGLRKDGSEFPVEISLSSWETDRGEVYHGIIHDITERKQAEEKLKSSLEEVRTLAAHLQSVREEERIRIARQIHDEVGQALTGLKMDLSWLASRLSEDQKPLLEKTKSMSTLVDTTLHGVREIATELRPGVLDDLGLAAAIEWQTQEFRTRTGIRCEATVPPRDIALDQSRSTAIFRIFQEILTNLVRHADATSVNVSLKQETRNLILEVRDNGKGIAESEISSPKSLGLLGMRERALLFGGEVRISGTRGKGTTVTVTIPLQQI